MSVRRFEEIEVERINVVDSNGTLRLAIHNRERIPDPVVDRQTFKRQGSPAAGFIFYNDEGDECGGFIWAGRGTRDEHELFHHISFDQYKQDQILTIAHGESNGQNTTMLTIQDRVPGVSVANIVREAEAIEQMEEGEDKQRKQADFQKKFWVHNRVMIGRDRNGEATLGLNDSKGRPRILLSVDSSDSPRFVFLDENGKVTLSLPPTG